MLAPFAGSLGHKPVDGLAQAVVEAGRGAEPEAFFGTACVKGAAGLAIRPGGVPDDVAVVSGHPGDPHGQVADADFDARAEVDRVRPIVAFGPKQDSLGGIADKEEFPAGRAVAPQHDLPLAALPGFEELADQCRDDVRSLQVEVVPWS